MANYDFTNCLSPLDFELLSKDLLEAELGIRLENFREGRDKGIDLRYAPQRGQGVIVQCKRYATFANLRSELANKEMPKIIKLTPARYILTTSVPLSPQQADELREVLSPFVQSTDDIYGRDRLNSILGKYPEIERRHIKLWVGSAGVLDSIMNAGTHVVSREEVERTIASAKIYVRNKSFDEALVILKQHHVCIIAGLPGIGKTTLARMLLLYFYERGYDVVKIESDISEARAVSYHNKPRFYYYDDFLGQTAQADKLNKNEDQKLLDFMCGIRESRDSVLVLTTREYILNQAKMQYEKLHRENFDHRTCVIDLSKYTRLIRAHILYNHLHFSDLPRPHLENLVANRGYVKIVDHGNYNPRLIEYLTSATWVGKTSPAEYLSLFVANLDNPVLIWEHAFRNQLSPGARHLLFALISLPRETILKDVELAFCAFHNRQCGQFGISHSADDFRRALRELDGTFVTTRKIQEQVLVRFQNPSVRDFMKYLLLNGELLGEVIVALVFFEQAEWFAETLNDPDPQVPLEKLEYHARTIADSLRRLRDAESCSISVCISGDQQIISIRRANPALRLVKFALTVARFNDVNDIEWILSQIDGLADKLEAGKLSMSSCLVAAKSLLGLGYLETDEGERFVTLMKSHVMRRLSDLDDFETIAQALNVLPRQTFLEPELDKIREDFTEFAEQYAERCDLDDPEELREEASRIENVGDLLRVNTASAQASLHDAADRIEEEQEGGRDWDPDEEDRGGGSRAPDYCSDAELDSIFSTLN